MDDEMALDLLYSTLAHIQGPDPYEFEIRKKHLALKKLREEIILNSNKEYQSKLVELDMQELMSNMLVQSSDSKLDTDNIALLIARFDKTIETLEIDETLIDRISQKLTDDLNSVAAIDIPKAPANDKLLKIKFIKHLSTYLDSLFEEGNLLLEILNMNILSENRDVNLLETITTFYEKLVNIIKLKLKGVEIQTRTEKFNHKILDALKNLQLSLDNQIQVLLERLNDVEALLKMYSVVGDEFLNIARRYKSVVNEINRCYREIDNFDI